MGFFGIIASYIIYTSPLNILGTSLIESWPHLFLKSHCSADWGRRSTRVSTETELGCCLDWGRLWSNNGYSPMNDCEAILSSSTVLTYFLSLCTRCSHSDTAPRDLIYLGMISFQGRNKNVITSRPPCGTAGFMVIHMCGVSEARPTWKTNSSRLPTGGWTDLHLTAAFFILSSSCDLPLTDEAQRANTWWIKLNSGCPRIYEDSLCHYQMVYYWSWQSKRGMILFFFLNLGKKSLIIRLNLSLWKG